jgi:hypothetical protein
MKTYKALTAFLLFAAMRSGTFAVTISLPAQKDNTVYLDLNGQLSNGQGIYLFAGRTTNDLLRRGLIAFDLTSIPANATITAATFSMFSNRPRPNDATVDVSLSRALRAWGEGTSDAGDPGGIGAQAETNDATWLHTFFNSNFWTTPGGDFATTPSATTPVLENGSYMWSGSGLLADVQSWVSAPATNFGWFILANEADSGTAQRFNTRENTIDAPLLTVTYQVSSSTPTPTPSSTPHTPTPTPSSTPHTPTPTPSSTPNTPTPTPTPHTPTPTPTATPTPIATPTPTQTPGTLGNISTRLRVLSGDNALIGGLIASGTAGKKVIIRAIGPSLSGFGVPGALTNPTLDLFQGSTLLLSNDDWNTSAQQAEIAASGLAPSNTAESAIIWTLTPGENYTAVVRGLNGTTGIGVVDAFDLDQAASSKLGNISTRGFVDVGDNVMIAGLIAGPSTGTSLKILARALGPTLSDFGVPGALVDPTLDLVNSNGTVIRSNNNWKDDPQQRAQIEAAGLAPSHDEESALVETVAPGAYTVVVRGNNRAIGVGLVEVYNIP